MGSISLARGLVELAKTAARPCLADPSYGKDLRGEGDPLP